MSDTAARVEVIIPTYNQADFLREALQSVLDQDFTDWKSRWSTTCPPITLET